MTLIIPGVEIRVIKELVPRQLGATGILGIVGTTDIDRSDEALRPVASLQEFREVFGPGSVVSMPEVAQAFANGVNEVVVANLPPGQGTPARRQFSFEADGQATQVAVRARAAGRYGKRILVRFTAKGAAGAELIDVEVFAKNHAGQADADARVAETFRNLSPKLDDERFFIAVLQRESAYITLRSPGAATHVVPANRKSDEAPKRLDADGDEPIPTQILTALERLETAPQIDLVTASIDYDGPNAHDRATEVYAGIVSHCQRMSAIARNRIGFGQIPEHGTRRPDLQAAAQMANVLTGDRFALVAPHGFLGAVVGKVAGLQYYQSPTFKTLTGVTKLSFDFSDSDLRTLLTAGVLPVDSVPRRGIAVVKGIFCDTSQISVQRIADRAVRHVDNIAQDFIGLLNTQAQRLALKQLIIGALTRMTNAGALVPSTDGESPPFVVDVASSGPDFAQGIVRVHCAVRPVRAIDYIYATILVQAT